MDVRPKSKEAAEAICKFQQLRQRQGKGNYATHAEHRCTPGCRLFRHNNIFVCHKSLHVHECGNRCSLGVLVREGYICSLTATVLDREEAVHVPFASVRGVSKPQVHWEEKHRRRKESAFDGIRHAISTVLDSIFNSQQRKNEARRAQEKASTDMAKTIRQCMSAADGTAVTLSTLLSVAQKTLESKGRAIRTAGRRATKDRLASLADDIMVYICTVLKQGRSKKLCIATTCVLVNLMSTGVACKGVTLIPRVEWIAASVPAEIQYGKICTVTCRAMSIKTRELKRKLVTPTGFPQIQYKMRVSQGTL